MSKSTFLSEKVSKLNIGYIIDPFDDNAIKQFVNGLSEESIEEKIDACINIPKKTCIIDEDIYIN